MESTASYAADNHGKIEMYGNNNLSQLKQSQLVQVLIQGCQFGNA